MTSRPARAAILALSQCLPYPPHTGVTNRIFHILAGLQQRFDVYLVPFVRRHHHPDPGAVRASRDSLRGELTHVAEPVPIPGERHRFRYLLNHLASVVSGQPYLRFEYAAPGFGRAIRDAVRRRAPALVHAESLDLYAWFRGLPKAPLTVTHQNVESDLLLSRANLTASAAVRAYLRLQAARLAVLERRWAPAVAENLMVSDLDAKRLHVLAPGASTLVVPNGVDLKHFAPSPESSRVRERVVFIGPTYVYQNREAMDWFLESIWPAILRKAPDATLDLLGGAPADDAARYATHRGVEVHGHVPDVRPYLKRAACSIVPLRMGGGTRLKILDAWAMQTPVVSTSVGCEGLETMAGENILIRDDPASFAEAVLSILQDSESGRRLGAAGRATAEMHYGWDRITRRLADRYSELIG